MELHMLRPERLGTGRRKDSERERTCTISGFIYGTPDMAGSGEAASNYS